MANLISNIKKPLISALITGVNGEDSGSGIPASIQSVIPSAVFDLDATQTASYAGTGVTWSNLVAVPADGSSQTAYDFFTGDGATSTTYPTFTGTPGSSSAYWSCDGGDYFNLKSGANTNFLRDMHKTTGGVNTTIILAMRSAGTLANASYLGTATATADHGCRFGSVTTGAGPRLSQTNGATNSVTTVSGTISPSTEYMWSIAFNYTANTVKSALNATTFTAGTLALGVSIADATNVFKIGGAGTAFVTNTTRIYGCYGFNTLLTNAELAAAVTFLNTRHGRTYA